MTAYGKSTIANLAWRDVAEVVKTLPFQYIEKSDAKRLYIRFYSRRDLDKRTERKKRAYTNHGSRDNFMRHKRAKSYGLTGLELERMEAAQGHACAICLSSQNRGYRGKERISLDIDHCHTTGKIRGLLCNACNRMLANAKDKPALLRAAATYLESHTNFA